MSENLKRCAKKCRTQLSANPVIESLDFALKELGKKTNWLQMQSTQQGSSEQLEDS